MGIFYLKSCVLWALFLSLLLPTYKGPMGFWADAKSRKKGAGAARVWPHREREIVLQKGA